MRLFEHEGKSLLARAGIPVPRGHVARHAADVKAALAEFGSVYVKAQVLWGSRGKQKAVLLCESEAEADRACASLFGQTFQGEAVEEVLAEERIPVAHEYYLSVAYQGCRPAVVASASGGIDIEDVQKQNPSAVVVQPVDIVKGLDADTALGILERAGFRDDAVPASEILVKLFDLFIGDDAVLAEINPLVKTPLGRWFALDAKIEIDDEALYRQEHLNLPERLSSGRKPTKLESQAQRNDQTDTRGASGRMFYEIPGGNIVILASGGGTSVEALDSLCLLGGKPAVFTEYSGNPSGEKVKSLTKIALSTEQPIDAIWVVGGRANFTDIFETLVNGVLAGIRELPNFDRTIPIIVRRAGPRDEDAFEALRKAREEEGYNIFIRGMGATVTHSARMAVHHAMKHETARQRRPQ